MNQSAWVLRPLVDVTTNLDARRIPVKEADRRRGCYPYYGASGIVDYVDDYLFEGLHLLVAEDGENLRSRKLPIAFLADGRFWVNNHAHIVQGNNLASTRFLLYALSISNIESYISGTTMPKLTQGNLNRVLVPVPDRSSQDAIVSLLGSLDDKIELNRRMNETLEAMAQAIFQDWFVEFGPTRRKLAGTTDPVEIMGGLVQDRDRAAALAGLFPDGIGDVGLPISWRDGNLERYATLSPETWSASNPPNRIEYVDLSNTKWGTIEATASFDWNEAPSRARRIARPGDTIVGTVRPGNGSYAYIGVDGLTVSTGFALLRPRSQNDREVVYLAATRKENIDRLAALADGGAYPAVRPELVMRTSVPLPGSAIVESFSKLTRPLMAQWQNNMAQNQTLAATRDLLLPKLMSGEIRIRDAEAIAGAAL